MVRNFLTYNQVYVPLTGKQSKGLLSQIISLYRSIRLAPKKNKAAVFSQS